MPVELRRTLLLTQTIYLEGWKDVVEPTRLISAIAIIRNPWFGRGHVEDMSPEIMDHCPELAELLTGMLLESTDSALESCGKASVVGMGGELEHAQALTHSLWWGNNVRAAMNASTYFVFTNTRGAAGCPIMIPLTDKDDSSRRSHYQTIHTTVPDAPADDEIVMALGTSVGGHPNHRIGDRESDLRAMNQNKTGRT
jgi:hypothetical protein